MFGQLARILINYINFEINDHINFQSRAELGIFSIMGYNINIHKLLFKINYLLTCIYKFIQLIIKFQSKYITQNINKIKFKVYKIENKNKIQYQS